MPSLNWTSSSQEMIEQGMDHNSDKVTGANGTGHMNDSPAQIFLGDYYSKRHNSVLSMSTASYEIKMAWEPWVHFCYCLLQEPDNISFPPPLICPLMQNASRVSSKDLAELQTALRLLSNHTRKETQKPRESAILFEPTQAWEWECVGSQTHTGDQYLPQRECTSSKRQVWNYPWKGGCPLLTIWGELVPLKHRDAEYVLLEVFDKELAVGVPLRIEGVLHCLGDVALRAHRHLTVWITLSWELGNKQKNVIVFSSVCLNTLFNWQPTDQVKTVALLSFQ